MDELFLSVAAMSITAGFLVPAVEIARLFLKKAPKWIPCLLWALVAVRLVCPWSLKSEFSVIPDPVATGDLVSRWAEDYVVAGATVLREGSVFYDDAVAAGREPVSDGEGGHYVLTAHDKLGPPATVKTAVLPLLSRIWGAGLLALVLYALIRYFRLRRRMKTAVPLKENIFLSEYAPFPFVLGLLRPRIYLPFRMAAGDMAHVIAHERAHIRRGDHLAKPLGFLLLCLHWFNPLLWLAYNLFCRDLELACDERVIRALDREARADYSQALLSCSVPPSPIALCPLAFGEVGVRERVKYVLNYQKPAFWLAAVAILASMAVAVCFFTAPPVPRDTLGFTECEWDPDGLSVDLKANLGRRVKGAALTPELWMNGECVKGAPVWLTQDGDAIHLRMRPRREGGATVGVDVQITDAQAGSTLSTLFPLPSAPVGSAPLCYEKGETLSAVPGEERILAALVFDLGGGVQAYPCEALDRDPELLQQAPCTLVIRASFYNTETPPEQTAPTRPTVLPEDTEPPVGDALAEAVTNAILAKSRDAGEEDLIRVESHVILGETRLSGTPPADGGTHENIVTVYALVLYQTYRVQDGKLSLTGGSHIPTAITFHSDARGHYILTEYWTPRDGSFYEADIREKFPKEAADLALSPRQYLEDQQQECLEKAQAILRDES